MHDALCSSLAILGVPFVNLTMDECVCNCERYIDEGRVFHQIATANSDFVLNAKHDIELRKILRRCDMVVADGMPLVWASRLMRSPLKQRVTGSDMVPELAKLAARRGFGIFLLGTSEIATKGAANWMEQHHPGVRIVGRYSPPYRSLEEMDHEAMLTRIEATKPDILLVAFGNPKQEKWLAMHRDRLRVPVCVGVGCSLDLLAGTQKRAPRWMQRSGLEWSYRAWNDPQRLAGRYAKNAYGLARYLIPQLIATAAQKGRNTPGACARPSRPT